MTPLDIDPAHLAQRVVICLRCAEKCERYRAAGLNAASGECERGLFTPRRYPAGSYMDHEKEAARAGVAAGCC